MRNRTVLLAAALGMVCFCSLAISQTIAVTGTVVDSATLQGIGNATVHLVDFPQLSAKTASNGTFSLIGTPTGVATAIAPKTGLGRANLDKNTLTINGLKSGALVTIEAFACNGARLFHAGRVSGPSGSLSVAMLGHEEGLYYVKVSCGGVTHTLSSLGAGGASMAIASSRLSEVAKRAASYTLEAAASGYSTKQTTITGLTGDVGTIRMTPVQPQTGVWTKINMPVSFTYAMSLLNDPARPSDFYGFLTDGSGTPITVVKSTDYGAAWVVVNTGTMTGDPWGAVIDPNPNRDPATKPVMYTPCGAGSLGLWKSIDGGVTWSNTLTAANLGPLAAYVPNHVGDPYAAYILPDNIPNHLLVTWHGYWAIDGDAGIGESTDGGATWMAHVPPPGIGQSHYLMIPNATTWISISQNFGMWKTNTAGRVNGVISTAAWKKVDTLNHLHGEFDGLVTSSAIYAPGNIGIKRSIDNGETWSKVYYVNDYTPMTNIVATAKYLYADNLGGPHLLRSPITDGATWTTYCTTPSGMAGQFGPGTSTHKASTDGVHWYIVAFQNNGGVWRYIE